MRCTLLVVILAVGCGDKYPVASAPPAAQSSSVPFATPDEVATAFPHADPNVIPESEPHRRIQRAAGRCKYYYDQAKMWQMITKRTPNSLHDLEAPLRAGEDDFVRVDDDPWGNRYVLGADKRKFTITSFGPDGQQGTADDIHYPPLEDD